MHLGYGGNPYGPAGTGLLPSLACCCRVLMLIHRSFAGKTESVKALGHAFGRQVLVFNCDEVTLLATLSFATTSCFCCCVCAVAVCVVSITALIVLCLCVGHRFPSHGPYFHWYRQVRYEHTQHCSRVRPGRHHCVLLGAWGCFDEFNRLKEDQLSAISQQIQV